MQPVKLWNKDFTLVVIGQIISLFGNAILRFALPLYLLRETGSAELFGIVTACSFLPMIVLSFLGGIIADRANKRNIMVILDFSTTLLITVLALALGRVPLVPLLICALMLLYGISGTYQPTVLASIPVLVPGESILSAGAVINQVGSAANMLGPVIGGALFGSFGIKPILLISIGCFFASAVMELFIRIPFTRRADTGRMLDIVKTDLRDSAHYIYREKPVLLQIILLVALFNLVLTAMIIVGVPIILVDTLGVSDALLGFAQGALALGGLFGGLLTALLSKRLRVTNAYLLLLECSLCAGIMALPLLLGGSQMVCYLIITCASFMMMASAAMFSIQILALIQTETPPELIGKVLALVMALSMSAQPIGQALYGILFDRLPGRSGWILVGVMCISVGIVLLSKRVFSRVIAGPAVPEAQA